VGARHGDAVLLKYTDVQNVAVLKKQMLTSDWSDVQKNLKQTVQGLQWMRKLRVR
jgi:hypothetical protein